MINLRHIEVFYAVIGLMAKLIDGAAARRTFVTIDRV